MSHNKKTAQQPATSLIINSFRLAQCTRSRNTGGAHFELQNKGPVLVSGVQDSVSEPDNSHTVNILALCDSDTSTMTSTGKQASYDYFDGKDYLQGKDWIENFARCLEVNGVPAGKSVQMMYIYLTGYARNWLNKLADNKKGDFATLKTAFLDHFKAPATLTEETIRRLYTRRQEKGQTGRDFAHAIQMEASGLNISDDELLRIIKGGLQPELRMLVATKQPTTIHALMELPFCNMDYSRDSKGTPSAESGGNTELIQQVKDCFTQFSKTMGEQMLAISANTAMVHAYDHSTNQPHQPAPQPQRHYRRPPQEPYRSPPQPPNHHGQQTYQPAPRNNNYGHRQGPQRSQPRTDTLQACRGCGKWSFDLSPFKRCVNCDARGHKCTFCGRLGHFEQVCYTKQQANSNHH